MKEMLADSPSCGLFSLRVTRTNRVAHGYE